MELQADPVSTGIRMAAELAHRLLGGSFTQTLCFHHYP